MNANICKNVAISVAVFLPQYWWSKATQLGLSLWGLVFGISLVQNTSKKRCTPLKNWPDVSWWPWQLFTGNPQMGLLNTDNLVSTLTVGFQSKNNQYHQTFISKICTQKAQMHMLSLCRLWHQHSLLVCSHLILFSALNALLQRNTLCSEAGWQKEGIGHQSEEHSSRWIIASKCGN